ncbi:MAG TPA: DUF4920 domain-containing protein [Chitinophagaceae bacterium]|nr:DUF4920 domain-containing protein [Chitinophagaceae bacterium]
MKQVMILCFLLGSAICLNAQQPTPAAKGVTYGAGTIADGAITVTEVDNKVKDQDKFAGRVKGKVVSVCKEKGCWMKIERENGEPMMVKFKDYGFFMPADIEGKEVVLDGEATIKETSVKQLRHYAQDAGKSKEEIEKIKTPKKDVVFVAKGVLVL